MAYRRSSGRDNKEVVTSGLFNTKTPGLWVATFRRDYFEKLADVIASANAEDGVVVFLREQDDRDRPFSLSIAPSKPQERQGGRGSTRTGSSRERAGGREDRPRRDRSADATQDRPPRRSESHEGDRNEEGDEPGKDDQW